MQTFFKKKFLKNISKSANFFRLEINVIYRHTAELMLNTFLSESFVDRSRASWLCPAARSSSSSWRFLSRKSRNSRTTRSKASPHIQAKCGLRWLKKVWIIFNYYPQFFNQSYFYFKLPNILHRVTLVKSSMVIKERTNSFDNLVSVS